ncbi:ChbG/HpnK family deacetylase [Paenibacillus sp. RC67]|uniref:ChbG/HpnK family deacetylase n=1 Tax=Paenibacillus sp. RC67 TaxID=3039392 RepID=UPI0024ADA881|nr:ChbG/HpnK family deacetylase [Paenibacillus sp. RC67]
MMPGETAKEAAAFCRRNASAPVGIHLTLTSSKECALKPCYQAEPLPSLVTLDGCFPTRVEEVEHRADTEQLRFELEAQIELALHLGVEPTHLDSHAGSVMGLLTGRDFLEMVFDLCLKYRLPFLLPRNAARQPFFDSRQQALLQQRITSALSRGVELIDDLYTLPYLRREGETYESAKEELIQSLRRLRPGITQITLHPSLYQSGSKPLTQQQETREMEYRLFQDPDIKRRIEQERLRLISWKKIRDVQRAGER